MLLLKKMSEDLDEEDKQLEKELDELDDKYV